MLDKVKLALSISANTYDTELTTWIQAAIGDLGIAGVEGETVTTNSTDAIIVSAIITYCGRQFELMHGSPERAQAYKESYDEQKAQLGMATGYTVWKEA